MRANGWLRKDFSEWIVSTDGSPNGRGTKGSPFDLNTALLGKSEATRIRPGDVVWLLGGRYRGSFTVKIGGSRALPLHVRQYPGERAVLDKSFADRGKGTLNVRRSHVWFWDLEITNSFPNRSRLDPAGNLKPWRGSGINVWAPNTKYINLSIHDNGHGIGLWNEDGGTEITGCLIFNNGNNKKEHGIYAHNKTGTQRIAGNIIFNNAGYGLHIYANSTKRSISGFEIENNIIFGNGALTLDDQVADQILVGGVEGVAADRIRLRGNVVYTDRRAPTSKSRGIRLGYRHKRNGNVLVTGNTIVARVPLKILWWNSAEVCGNYIHSKSRLVEIRTSDPNSHTYSNNNLFIMGEPYGRVLLNGNKSITGSFGRKSNSKPCRTNSVSESHGKPFNYAFVFPKEYDRSRAFVAVYNSERKKEVSVDPDEFLFNVRDFDVRDLQAGANKNALDTRYVDRKLVIPVSKNRPILPIGGTEKRPIHTGPEFSVFEIKKNR